MNSTAGERCKTPPSQRGEQHCTRRSEPVGSVPTTSASDEDSPESSRDTAGYPGCFSGMRWAHGSPVQLHSSSNTSSSSPMSLLLDSLWLLHPMEYPLPHGPESFSRGVQLEVCSPSQGKEDDLEYDETYFKRPPCFFGLQQAHLHDNITMAWNRTFILNSYSKLPVSLKLSFKLF